ncbi:putative E3 ubiquitin-protein ligase MARCHF10 [Glossophaga mutica]
MLHEARDRQKFLSDVQYLREMQHKVESEYQACLRRHEYRRDSNENYGDQSGGQETNLEKSRFSNGTSSKQTSGEEDPLAKPKLAVKNSAVKCESRLPAIDQTSVKQKDKSTMTIKKPENVGPSKPFAKNDSGDSDNEDKTFRSRDTKLNPNLEDGLSAKDAFSDDTSAEDRTRSPMNSSCNTPGSLAYSALTDGGLPVDVSMTSTLVHSSNSEGTSRLHARRPLSPIRNRNPFACPENHGYFPANSAREFDVRGAEASASTSQSQGAPLYTEDLLLNPQRSLSLAETSSSSASRVNLQGRVQVHESLQEDMPLALFAASDSPNRNRSGNRMAVSGFTGEKAATKIKADPEKLKKFQESLLEEDSEEEGDLCRICQMTGGSPTNPLLEPCGCVGSLQFVHQECLKKWLKVKITSGADLGAVKTCEMCKQGLLVDLDDFNLTDFYRKHQQSRVQNELMNSGLYLVLLLHLYEQRFAELIRLNYSRAARARLSRNFPQPRPEDNESTPTPAPGNRSHTQMPQVTRDSELGDGNENGIYQGNSRVV